MFKLPLFPITAIVEARHDNYIPLLSLLKKFQSENTEPDETINRISSFTGYSYCEENGEPRLYKDGKFIKFSWQQLIDGLCDKHRVDCHELSR